jgi:hypothetical protein
MKSPARRAFCDGRIPDCSNAWTQLNSLIPKSTGFHQRPWISRGCSNAYIGRVATTLGSRQASCVAGSATADCASSIFRNLRVSTPLPKR